MIAVTINAHDNLELLKDTVEAVKKYVTKDIQICVDGAAWATFGTSIDIQDVKIIPGFIHAHANNPYKNVAYSLKKAEENFPDAKWYCYMEADVLFTNSGFIDDLKNHERNNCWVLAADHRRTMDTIAEFEFIDRITNIKFWSLDYILGCCVFYHRTLIKSLAKMNFFDKLLQYSIAFEKGKFPKFNGYDLSEQLYPTLAIHLGGDVAQFSRYGENEEKWYGDYKKYPMRFRPEIKEEETYEETCIIHPSKDNSSPVREKYRAIRNQTS